MFFLHIIIDKWTTQGTEENCSTSLVQFLLKCLYTWIFSLENGKQLSSF